MRLLSREWSEKFSILFIERGDRDFLFATCAGEMSSLFDFLIEGSEIWSFANISPTRWVCGALRQLRICWAFSVSALGLLIPKLAVYGD